MDFLLFPRNPEPSSENRSRSLSLSEAIPAIWKHTPADPVGNNQIRRSDDFHQFRILPRINNDPEFGVTMRLQPSDLISSSLSAAWAMFTMSTGTPRISSFYLTHRHPPPQNSPRLPHRVLSYPSGSCPKIPPLGYNSAMESSSRHFSEAIRAMDLSARL